MKSILKTAAALIALASPAFADPAEGTWQTEPDDGAFAYITMAPCSGGLEGKQWHLTCVIKVRGHEELQQRPCENA